MRTTGVAKVEVSAATVSLATVEVRYAVLTATARFSGGGKDGGKDGGKGFDPDDPEYVDRIARTIHIGNLANEAAHLHHHSAAQSRCGDLLAHFGAGYTRRTGEGFLVVRSRDVRYSYRLAALTDSVEADWCRDARLAGSGQEMTRFAFVEFESVAFPRRHWQRAQLGVHRLCRI
jgi:hypothetical protein